MRRSFLFVASAVLSICACSADEPLVIGNQDKSDSDTLIVTADRGYQAFTVQCPAFVGCDTTLIFDFNQVGATRGNVSVLVGRTQEELREVGSTLVEGSTELILDVLEEPDLNFDAGGVNGYDAYERILVLVQIADDNPVSFSIMDCPRFLGDYANYLFGGDTISTERVHQGIDRFTLREANEEAVFTFEVVDESSFDASIQRGNIVEIGQSGESLSPESILSATYTCKSDGEVLDFHSASSGSIYNLGLDPDCSGLDDSGLVTVVVSDPKASLRGCPSYSLRAHVQPAYL